MCLNCVEKDALAAMKLNAQALGVQGVAVVLTTDKKGGSRWDPLMEVVGRFHREADESKGVDDTGASYAAVAWSKVAEMLDTGRNSGTTGRRKPKKGEFGYRGGLVEVVRGLKVYIAFSGGTEDQDVEIAKAGMVAFKKSADKLIEERMVQEAILEIILS